MKVTRLKIANMRAIETAEFRFLPGFNLIVGENGVGKSSVLDAIRICMSRILPSITESRAKTMSFRVEDIRCGFPFLDVGAALDLGGKEFLFTRLQWASRIAVDDPENLETLRRQIRDSERLQDRARNLLRKLDESQGVSDSDVFAPSKIELRRVAQAVAVPPNCIFFSTNRSVVSDANATKGKAVGGAAAAYADALIPRPWQIGQFVAWMRVQRALAEERPGATRHLEILETAATRFLPKYNRIRPDDGDGSRLLINKEGITLDVNQLSDGERGVLAMVLDVARRLSQANPKLDDPLREGEAIVLIDELDLHLHPAWQRQIAHKLIDVFPRCQFIATTHSPQVIGEIEHDRIQIISDGRVYSPTHSFGIDSSRVLEEIMGAPRRSAEIQDLLLQVSRAIGTQELNKARELLHDIATRLELGENDPEVTHLQTLLDFMEGNE